MAQATHSYADHIVEVTLPGAFQWFEQFLSSWGKTNDALSFTLIPPPSWMMDLVFFKHLKSCGILIGLCG